MARRLDMLEREGVGTTADPEAIDAQLRKVWGAVFGGAPRPMWARARDFVRDHAHALYEWA
eukprot:606528-Alexandrium_andersonii.AAC.1